MNEWPEGWFRDGAGGAGTPAPAGSADEAIGVSGGTGGAAGAADPAGATARISSGTSGAGAGQAGSAAWPDQPPVRSARPALRGGASIPGAGGPRRWLRPRRILAVLAILVSLVLIFVVAMYFFLDSKLHRKDILVNYSGRPAASAGTNWLIAGSDSRQGLTRRQERRLKTGFDIGGQRSDTIMLLHLPANGGPPVLISLPRDSWVPVPGYGYSKLNAAYSLGGPRLLAKTVQAATGLRISHYMGIGFGGFVRVVNDVGGVHLCLKHTLRDPASGLHLRKGCQTLDGAQALGFVRSRHLFTNQDLQRVQDQRILLRSLLSKMTSPGVILNPFASVPASIGVAGTLTVDQGTSLYQLIEVAFALRHPETTTVPIGNSGYVTPTGQDAVLWNTAEANQLFRDLKYDRRVPKTLITGSHQAA